MFDIDVLSHACIRILIAATAAIAVYRAIEWLAAL